MTETLGPFTVDAAEGILHPAKGIDVVPNPSPPPDYIADNRRSNPVPSPILTVRAFATPAAALAEAAAYAAAIGSVVTFRGIPCFVADVVCEQRAAEMSSAGASVLVGNWTLAATLGWVPV